MSFDLDKMQAVIELGEVIRLQNDALERLVAFRKARPNMMMPNLAKMVEENLKENVQVLYKELNNMHKPPAQQTRHICRECKMAYLSPLPGGICDECRARKGASQPRAYGPQGGGEADEVEVAGPTPETPAAATPDQTIAPATETAPSAEEDAVADAYESAIGAPDEKDEAEAEKLMAEPKAINLSADDTELYMADGEEVSSEPARAAADEEPREAVETISDHDVSPLDSSEPGNDEPAEEEKT